MSFYQQHIDCGREQNDSYTNTPHASYIRNHAPTFIHFRWGKDLDARNAVIEFYNYYSILPLQHAKTITSRSTFGVFPATSPDLQLPISATVSVPPFAQRFRIRLNRGGPMVTNFVPVRPNAIYYYEGGRLFEMYGF